MQAESNVVEFPAKEKKKELRMSLVPSQEIGKYWHIVTPGLEQTISKSGNETTLDYILDSLMAGTSWLWIGMSGIDYGGVMVTEVLSTNTGNWLNIPLAYSVPPSGR